eukprot:COSAG04_NODE_11_length_42922_cov_38.819700_20_plen_409_part_00
MEAAAAAAARAPFTQGESVLGIDVGGVLTVDTDAPEAPAAGGAKKEAAAAGGKGWNLPVDMQSRPPTDECVAVVAALVRLFSPERTFIVSKCSEHVQRATVVWLRKFDFFARTGVLPAHVAFCRNRSGIEGEGEALAWAPLAPPESERLTELCEAAAREPEELLGWFGEGLARSAKAAVPLPGVPSANCGKGVLGRELRLTHFIDDRAECLHSIFFEGWMASEEGGGLERAAERGAMLHFGPTVASKAIAKKATSDADLLRLMPALSKPKQKKPQAAAPSAEEVWSGMDEELRAKWGELQALRESKPAVPGGKKGRPPPEVVAALKAYGAKEKAFRAQLSKEGAALLKRYEKALAQKPAKPAPAPAPAAAAAGGEGGGRGRGARHAAGGGGGKASRAGEGQGEGQGQE